MQSVRSFFTYINTHFRSSDLQSFMRVLEEINSKRLDGLVYSLVFQPDTALNQTDIVKLTKVFAGVNNPNLHVTLILRDQGMNGDRLKTLSTLFSSNAPCPPIICLQLGNNLIRDQDMELFSNGLTGLGRIRELEIELCDNPIT